MRPLFNDPAHQRSFDNLGYIQIPLLSEIDIKTLLAVFEQYKLQYSQSFHTSHFSSDIEYKRKVHETISQIVFTNLKDLLISCKPIFGNFMIKNPDKNIFMPLHADWAYVDESRERSLAVWIPLVDTGQMNGCIGIIEGSHKVLNTIRGPRIPQSSYQNDKIWVKKYGKLLPCKAGNAILYDHALMHYSPPNESDAPRPAINLSIVPKDAEIVHYCIPEGANDIEKYKVKDSQFYLEYTHFQRPQSQFHVATFPANIVNLIDDKMNHYKPPKAKSLNLWSRFFGV